jgi:hypothetical protein
MSTANKYNTIPHHDFNALTSGDAMAKINLKMDSVKDKMTVILQGLNQLMVMMYH